MAKKKKKTVTVTAEQFEPKIKEGEELLALVDSEAKANEIAKNLNISLVQFTLGVATYHTTEDPFSVVEKARVKGYQIGVNTIQELIKPVNGKISFD